MNSKNFAKIIKGIIIFIFGLFDIILLIRMLLKLIGASEQSTFVSFWYVLSNPLYSPFHKTLEDFASGNLTLEINSIIAIVTYFMLAVFALKITTGIFHPKLPDKLRSIIDTVFKTIEVILGLRLLFKLLGAANSVFIAFLYGISYPFYAPFHGILKPIGQGSVVFETSTFVAVIIIIILDFASDKLLTEIFKEDQPDHEPMQPQQPGQPQVTPQQPQAQQSQQQPTVSVNVAPGQAPQQYPSTQDQQPGTPSAEQQQAGQNQPQQTG